GHLCRLGCSLCPSGLAHALGARRVLSPERYAGPASQSAVAATQAGWPACGREVGTRMVRLAPVRVAAACAASVWVGGRPPANVVHRAFPGGVPPQTPVR